MLTFSTFEDLDALRKEMQPENKAPDSQVEWFKSRGIPDLETLVTYWLGECLTVAVTKGKIIEQDLSFVVGVQFGYVMAKKQEAAAREESNAGS